MRLAEEPGTTGAKITLEALDRDGKPDDQQASYVRQVVEQDGVLSRSPTVAELEFLKHLRVSEGYGKRNLLIR